MTKEIKQYPLYRFENDRITQIKCENCHNVRHQTIKEVKDLITKEIVIAQKEGTPTARLTSLYNKIIRVK